MWKELSSGDCAKTTSGRTILDGDPLADTRTSMRKTETNINSYLFQTLQLTCPMPTIRTSKNHLILSLKSPKRIVYTGLKKIIVG